MIDLVGPLLARARDVFWGLKHLLLGNSPISDRLFLLDRVVLASFSWCIGAIPPDRTALHAVNSYLYQMVAWCMNLKRRPGEDWLAHRLRSLRGARNLVFKVLGKRWSTVWLERVWSYAGHRARLPRGFLASKILCDFRTRFWWHNEQGQQGGERHPRRFFPRLTLHENALDEASGGSWREVAQDRWYWKSLLPGWVSSQDVAWASGKQDAICA